MLSLAQMVISRMNWDTVWANAVFKKQSIF